jgi:hypothetical protein
MLRRIGCALIALGLVSAPAASQTVEYVYTKFDSKQCKHTKGRAVEDYGSWLCPGHEKIAVRLSAGDQRMYVTYGSGQKDDLAASQTLSGFNDVYEGTVEWRHREEADGRAGPSPRSCAGTWSRRTARMPPVRSRAPAASWS